MMQKMETHRSELGTELTLLENELHSTAPNEKKVVSLAASIRAHLAAMLSMQQRQPVSKWKM